MSAGDGASAESQVIGYLDLSRICGHLLRRSQQMHFAIWADVFGAELTSPQYGVLSVLAHHSGLDQRRLGELVSLDRSSTADVVARLESKMWLRRRRDPNDGRRNILELAPAATIAFEHLTPMAQRVQDRLVAPVPEGRRKRLVDWLGAVARVERSLLDHDEHDTSPAGLALHLDVPGHLIRRAQQVHASIWAAEFNREITGPQYATMQVLAQHPGINQRQAGELAALDRSNVADVVQRLVRRGWILRRRDPNDGRGHLLDLSEEARALVLELAPRVAGVQTALLSPVLADEQAEFLRLLRLVAYGGRLPDAG